MGPDPLEAEADAPDTDPSSESTANLVSVDKVDPGPPAAEAPAPWCPPSVKFEILRSVQIAMKFTDSLFQNEYVSPRTVQVKWKFNEKFSGVSNYKFYNGLDYNQSKFGLQ